MIFFFHFRFYTYMLILASIAGIISFTFSIKWMDQNPIAQQICNTNQTIVMCPLCDVKCDYWDLKETCLQTRITSLFDNQVTVVFAIFMSFWAALFLELWKRYSAEITHRWDLTGFGKFIVLYISCMLKSHRIFLEHILFLMHTNELLSFSCFIIFYLFLFFL